jgi:hypothetical protein
MVPALAERKSANYDIFFAIKATALAPLPSKRVKFCPYYHYVVARRRTIVKPIAASAPTPVNHVEGSGTAMMLII